MKKVALAILMLGAIAAAQDSSKQTTVAPCPAQSTSTACDCASQPIAQSSPYVPDLSEAAKNACTKEGEFWDKKLGCLVLLEEPWIPLLIDPQSTSVDHHVTDWEFNSVPVERNIGGILSLP